MKKNLLFLLVSLLIASGGEIGATSIYDIQFNDSDPGFISCYPSDSLLRIVTVTGVVSAVNSADPTSFYLQDADTLWSGIYVDSAGTSVSLGDSATITAEVNEETDDGDGYTFLANVTGLTVHSSLATVFDRLSIATGMLSQACNDSAEAYEGMLVLTGAVEVTQAADGNGRWMADDGSGAIYIGSDFFSYNPTEGESLLAISGVVSSFTSGSTVGYVVLPRSLKDLAFPSGNRRPNISDVSLDPSEPTSMDDVAVSATITDDSEVASAYVLYGVNDNSVPDTVTMYGTGAAYTATIPPTDTAGWLFYQVAAVDDSGAVGTSALDSVQITHIVSMADVQTDPAAWSGQTITCQGVVTVGVGILRTDRMEAYFQDNSGRGMMLFSFNIQEYTTSVVRGNLLRATGEFEYFEGDTPELKDPVITILATDQSTPSVPRRQTGDTGMEGWLQSWVYVCGEVTSVGSGADRNIDIDDGSGILTVRVWGTTGINIDDSVTVGMTYSIFGIGGFYNGKQLTPGYQQDIFPGCYVPGGVGVASIRPTSVKADESNLVETVTISADSSVTLDVIKIVIPNGWTWENPSVASIELFGDGIDTSAVTITVQSNSILLNGTGIAPDSSGTIRISNLKSPITPGFYTFQVLTSYESNSLEEIARSPQVAVEGAKEAFVLVPAKVMIPDYGEKMPITYAAPVNSDILIQIYDVEGTLIATLLDEAYDPEKSEVIWDGRDRLKEIVPIGVYICYLEAIEKLSGRITVDKAPIVVAIPLK